MAKIAYLECPTGLAGDMCLGALVHAGVPLSYLIDQLAKLGISHEYKLWAEFVLRNGQQATKVHVDLMGADISNDLHDADPHTTFARSPQELPHTHPHAHHHDHHPHAHDDPQQHHDHHSHPHDDHSPTRHLPEIEALIKAADLPERVTAWSLAIFQRLAEAEGAVHGIAPDQVHFHEVGATDAIVDIVGTCLGLDWLNLETIYCSAMPTGGGTIRAAHGRLPVPTPAVLKLWQMRQVPLYSNGIDRELVTPTGAAIVTTLATRFGSPPPMTLQQIGLGAGSRDLPIPNIVRLWIGEGAGERQGSGDQGAGVRGQGSVIGERGVLRSAARAASGDQGEENNGQQETIALLETQVDDLSPQAIGYLYEALLAAGAADVFTQAIGMKKSRPGVLISVVCHPEQVTACETILFQETTTLGIRRSTQQRTILYREMDTVQTQYGRVTVKVARREKGGAIVNVQPEYEDCAQLARQFNLPWREIHRLAIQEWYGNRSVR